MKIAKVMLILIAINMNLIEKFHSLFGQKIKKQVFQIDVLIVSVLFIHFFNSPYFNAQISETITLASERKILPT